MRTAFLAVACVAAVALGAHAQVFKWTDENGRVHYGERPPEGVKASEISVKTEPPSTARPEAPQDWSRKDADYKRLKIEREQKERLEQVQQADREKRAAARRRVCMRAREEYELFKSAEKSGTQVWRKGENGERVYLDDATRRARIADAQKRIDENCER